MQETFKTAIEKAIKSLGLKGFDWDNERGLPMRGDVRDLAHDLFCDPERYSTAWFADFLPLPRVILNPNGTLEIAFEGYDGEELLFTVECDSVLTYAKLFSDGQTCVDGVIRIDLDADQCDGDGPDWEVFNLLHWIGETFE